jgi:hypothetical protein
VVVFDVAAVGLAAVILDGWLSVHPAIGMLFEFIEMAIAISAAYSFMVCLERLSIIASFMMSALYGFSGVLVVMTLSLLLFPRLGFR